MVGAEFVRQHSAIKSLCKLEVTDLEKLLRHGALFSSTLQVVTALSFREVTTT